MKKIIITLFCICLMPVMAQSSWRGDLEKSSRESIRKANEDFKTCESCSKSPHGCKYNVPQENKCIKCTQRTRCVVESDGIERWYTDPASRDCTQLSCIRTKEIENPFKEEKIE